MTHPVPLPERDSGDGRRAPRCICRTSNGVHAQGCMLARPLDAPLPCRSKLESLWDEMVVPAYRSTCGCGLARVPHRIGRTDGLVCPVCDRA